MAVSFTWHNHSHAWWWHFDGIRITALLCISFAAVLATEKYAIFAPYKRVSTKHRIAESCRLILSHDVCVPLAAATARSSIMAHNIPARSCVAVPECAERPTKPYILQMPLICVFRCRLHHNISPIYRRNTFVPPVGRIRKPRERYFMTQIKIVLMRLIVTLDISPH